MKIFLFHRLSAETKFFTATNRMHWKKFCSATSRMRRKKNFSPLPAECGERKFFTAKIANLTNINNANFNAYLIFTGNVVEVRDRWRSGLRGSWNAWEESFEPLELRFFFVRKLVIAVKKIFSPLKIAKNSPHSTLKDAGALRALCGDLKTTEAK